MIRICPDCRAILNSHDSYFCSSCGSELPAHLIMAEQPIARFLAGDDDVISKKDILLKGFAQSFKDIFHVLGIKKLVIDMVILLAIVVGIIAWVQFSGFERLYSLVSSINVSKTPKTTVGTSSQGVKPSSHVFGISTELFVSNKFKPATYRSIVPFDVDVFAETADLSGFAKALVDADPAYQPLADELLPNVENSAYIYTQTLQGKSEVTVIGFKKSSDYVVSSEVVSKYSWLTIGYVNDFVIISTSKTALEDIKQIQAGLAKNLTMTSKYAVLEPLLPGEGKALVVFFSDRAVTQVETFNKLKFSDSARNLLKTIVTSKEVGVVIK